MKYKERCIIYIIIFMNALKIVRFYFETIDYSSHFY